MLIYEAIEGKREGIEEVDPSFGSYEHQIVEN